jgi:ABC-type branched-subunit amino acid transport system substrate-binding protein
LLQFRLGGGAWRSIGYFAATYTSPKLIKNKAYSFRLVPYDSTIAGKISPAAKITVK